MDTYSYLLFGTHGKYFSAIGIMLDIFKKNDLPTENEIYGNRNPVIGVRIWNQSSGI